MRHLASTLMLIIANNCCASVVDAQITGNGWPSVQALGCKFTDKPSQLEENSRNCPASTGSTASTSTASKASAAHSGPINIMEALSPPLTSSSVTHNDQKILDRARQKGSACSYCPYTITIISPSDGDLIRSNSGALNIIINVKAPKTEAAASLEKLDGLVHKIFLDGKLVASGIGSTFQLQAVDRGVHSLKATLHRGQEEIQQSPPLTFTLLRHSSIRR